MPKEDISGYNATWGICGFTSALTHLYDSDLRLRGKIDNSTAQTVRMGLLVEVVTFLKYVRAFRGDLIGGLNALNLRLQSPSMNNGVAGFIPLAEAAVRNQVVIGISNAYQCALTPEALLLYVKKICGLEGATLTQGHDPGGRGILSIMNANDELVHWVFRDANGTVYNWGSVISPTQWNTHAHGLGHPALDHVGCHVSLG